MKYNVSANVCKNVFDTSTLSIGIKDEPLGSSTPTNPILETLKKGPLTPREQDTAKKQKFKANVFTEQSLSAIKGTRTRNQEKILQEKNTNVKMIAEKCQEAQKKKEDIIKSSAEEVKRFDRKLKCYYFFFVEFI